MNQGLFSGKENKKRTSGAASVPLAERVRPQKLSEFIGQTKIIGPGRPLTELIKSDSLQSLIFWGPPGTGKTTLAHLIANYSQAHFVHFSAVTSGVAEVRKVVHQAQDDLKFYHRKTILFVDEIHRFNKGQQDAFLPHVENGTITLIGATTENPAFALTAPLLSRSRLFVFEPLQEKEVLKILTRASQLFPEHRFEKKALALLAHSAEGDARAGLNGLELAARLAKKVDTKVSQQAIQRKTLYFDKKGDWHYDTISAFIKSMRGSDPDAALYWLARMLEAGEDPRFVARRMTIFASEDVGNADPHALTLASSCFTAIERVGMPEAQIILGQTASYLACAPKSNASYLAISQAMETVRNERLEPVPQHLRNAPTKLAKELGYGADYLYPHNFAGGQVNQTYLPDNLKHKKFYQPKDIGYEKKIKARLNEWETLKKAGLKKDSNPNDSKPKMSSNKCPKGLGK